LLAGYAYCHGSNEGSSEKINNLAKQPTAVCIIQGLTLKHVIKEGGHIKHINSIAATWNGEQNSLTTSPSNSEGWIKKLSKLTQKHRRVEPTSFNMSAS